MECGKCGLALIVPASGYFEDGQQLLCEGCGAKNQVSCDDDDGPIYVGRWWCAHGLDEDTQCAACDAIDYDEDEMIEERS